MTSKIIVNTIEADTGISSVTFASNINLANDSSILVSSSGIRLGTGSTIAAPSANEITLSTNSAERLRLTSAGNLGIGDASPTKPLTVGTTTPVILLDDQSSRTLEIRGPSATHNATVLTTSVHDLLLGTNNAERLRITSGGNVGIGSVIPANVLDVQGTTHTKIHVGTTGTGHATGIQINHAKGNAALQEWQLQTDGSADGNLKIRNATSSTDVMFFDADNNNIGINETSPSHVLDIKSRADSTYFINGQNHNGNNIFQVYESSDGDGNHGMLYLNNGSGTTLTKISTNGPSYFNGGSIGVNTILPDRKLEVVDTNSNGSYPLAVSNFINATANKGAAIDFRLTTGGNTRGEIGCKWTSNSSSDGTALYFAPNDGSTGNVERMRITHDGYVLKSDTPAFNCKLSTATASTFTGTLVFNSVSYNIGNNYSSSNGRFTAPVDGRYLFAFYTNVEKGGSAGVIWGDWFVNGNARGNRFYTRWDGNWELIGGTIILDLNTNDYVTVNATTAGKWDGGSYGSYSGYLLG